MAISNPPSSAHWRDSARPARFFIFNSTGVFPLLVFLFHIRLWTFIVAIIVMSFLSLLERYGFNLEVFGRWFRSILAGRRKIAHPWWM